MNLITASSSLEDSLITVIMLHKQPLDSVMQSCYINTCTDMSQYLAMYAVIIITILFSRTQYKKDHLTQIKEDNSRQKRRVNQCEIRDHEALIIM